MKSIKLTSHRIFGYGCTKDLTAMINSTLETYPNTRAVVVGFSMGANMVIKYLGEKGIHVPKNILGGISICQGYDALKYNQFYNLRTGF